MGLLAFRSQCVSVLRLRARPLPLCLGTPVPKESQVAPVGVAAVAGDGRITVTWTDGTSGNVSLYEYKKDADDWLAVSVYPLAILGVNGTAITVRIRLKATLEKLAGEPSEPVTETPRADARRRLRLLLVREIANQILTVGVAMPAIDTSGGELVRVSRTA